MIFRRSTFTSTIADLETGVRAGDLEAARRAFDLLQKGFAKAGTDEIAAGAPRLAALLPEVPLGPRSMLAVIIGACVERGVNPAGCAPAVLREVGVVLTLSPAKDFHGTTA